MKVREEGVPLFGSSLTFFLLGRQIENADIKGVVFSEKVRRRNRRPTGRFRECGLRYF